MQPCKTVNILATGVANSNIRYCVQQGDMAGHTDCVA